VRDWGFLHPVGGAFKHLAYHRLSMIGWNNRKKFLPA